MSSSRLANLLRGMLPGLVIFTTVSALLLLYGDDLRGVTGMAGVPADDRAAQHRLYQAPRPADPRCRALDRPGRDAAALRVELQELGRCLNRAWAASLERVAHDYRPPGLRLIAEREQASCGRGDERWSGIYCSRRQTINLLLPDRPLSRYGELGKAFTLAHEYAHHVQHITGIADPGSPRMRDPAWSRRMELQADCLAALALPGLTRHATDLDEVAWRLLLGGRTGPRDDRIRNSHGSGASSSYWTRRGFDADSPGACNTWVASVDEVS